MTSFNDTGEVQVCNISSFWKILNEKIPKLIENGPFIYKKSTVTTVNKIDWKLKPRGPDFRKGKYDPLTDDLTLTAGLKGKVTPDPSDISGLLIVI